MPLRLKREVNPIKNGFRSRAVTLGLAAHGHSPEVADLNLERTVRQFLAPFERGGCLDEALASLGAVRDDGEVPVRIEFD